MNQVKLLVIILLVVFLFSCKEDNKKLSNKSIPVKTKDTVKLTNDIKSKLFGGIWLSDNYKKELSENNSIVNSYNKLKTYSIIIYDGKTTLHCNYPYSKEEHYLTLVRDSSLKRGGEMAFKIITINDIKMKIKNNNGEIFEYKKLKKNVKSENISLALVNEDRFQEKKWFAGNYRLSLNEEYYEIQIDSLGFVRGKSPYTEARIFPWHENKTKKGFDVINFKSIHKEDYYFIVELATNDKFFIREIEQPNNIGVNLIEKGVKGYLERSYFYEKQITKAVSLDSLITEEEVLYKQDDFDFHIQDSLQIDELGCYNLDSLQLLYQSFMPKSNILSIKNFTVKAITTLGHNTEEALFENKIFQTYGIMNNLTNKNIIIPNGNIYLVTVSSKNEVVEQLIHLNFFEDEYIKAKGALLYSDIMDIPFYKDVQSIILDVVDGKEIFTPLFHEQLNENEKYLYFFKFETEQGNAFYSDVNQIICHKNYNYSDLDFLEKNSCNFDDELYEKIEFFYEKGEIKQKLKLFFSYDRRCFFKLNISTPSCKKDYFGEARPIFLNGEYYVQNSSEIYKFILSVDNTKVKIILHNEYLQGINDCSTIETIMELKK